MKAILCLVCLVLFSCKSRTNAVTIAPSSSTPTPSTKIVDTGSTRFTLDKDRDATSGTIDAISYNPSTHAVQLTFHYAGCSETTHGLAILQVCAQSYPQLCSGVITHAASYDASCKTLHRASETMPLPDKLDATQLSVFTKEGQSKTVLIDRHGKIKAGTTPP